MSSETGADVLIRTLSEWGVRHVFICPGTTEAAVLDATLRHPEVQFILTTHESIAVAAADGYARAAGVPGVAFLHTNVGLTNGVGHLYAAQLAYSPVVVLNGLKPQSIQGRHAFTHSRHNREFVRPYVRWDWQNLRSEELAEDVGRALQAALSPPSGPSFLALSQDILTAPASTPPGPGPTSASHRLRHRPDRESVIAAAALMLNARRPLMVVGGPRSTSAGILNAVAVADLLGAPVSVDARFDLEAVTFPTDHRLYVGLFDPSMPAASEADLVFIAGAGSPIDFEERSDPRVSSGQIGIHLCADPDQLGRTHRTDVALFADLESGLEDLLQELTHQQSTTGRELDSKWVDTMCAAATRPATFEPAASDARSTVAAVAAVLPDNAIVVSDAVTTQNHMLDFIGRTRPGSYLASASGSLGWGAGAAVGTGFAVPNNRTIAMLGDGAFQFGIQSLWTAAHYALPITFCVYNNSMYLAVRSGLLHLGGTAAELDEYPCVDISGPDIAAIAAGFGVPAMRATNAGEASDAMCWANGHEGPALIELLVATPQGIAR